MIALHPTIVQCTHGHWVDNEEDYHDDDDDENGTKLLKYTFTYINLLPINVSSSKLIGDYGNNIFSRKLRLYMFLKAL